MDLTRPQLCSDSVRPGRCLSASSFTGRANLLWNLEGIKPWLKIEVFVTGQGDGNGKILPNHLPGCQRSSFLPLAAFGCLEFAMDFRQAAKGLGEMNMCTEKWPEFICCDRNGAPLHRCNRFLQPWDGEASAGLTKAVQGCINLSAPTWRLLSPWQHQWSKAVVLSQTLQLQSVSITPNNRGWLKIKCWVAEKVTHFYSLCPCCGTVVFGTQAGQTQLVKLKVAPEGDAARSMQPTGVASGMPGHCWSCMPWEELSPVTPPTLPHTVCVLQMEALTAPAGKLALGCFSTDVKAQKWSFSPGH